MRELVLLIVLAAFAQDAIPSRDSGVTSKSSAIRSKTRPSRRGVTDRAAL
jgi:hypothetical protein